MSKEGGSRAHIILNAMEMEWQEEMSLVAGVEEKYPGADSWLQTSTSPIRCLLCLEPIDGGEEDRHAAIQLAVHNHRQGHINERRAKQ